MAENERGFRWWLRFVIVPIIGSGGVVAIVVALINQPAQNTPAKITYGPQYNQSPAPSGTGHEQRARPIRQANSSVDHTATPALNTTTPAGASAQQEPMHTSSPVEQQRSEAPITTAPHMKQKVADLELELASCQHRRGDVICELRVTNLLDDHKYMLLGQAYETVTRAVDDHGAIFPAIRVKLGDKDGKQYAEVILPSTVPVSCEIQFSGVPDSTALFSLVEIHFTDDWNTRPKGPKFQFRSVPIT